MQSILQRNPEFAKNIWLEITPSRLIVMPLALGLIFIVGAILPHDNLYERLGTVATYAFRVIMLIWAVKPAADSIIDEYNGSTWDWQKMSLIGPWKMTWGKLFGSTIYNWYGELSAALSS